MGEIVVLFDRGGPLMWVLLFLLAATIAILLDRGLYFLATSLPRNATAEHWERRLGSYPGIPESGAKLMEDLESSLRSYERRAFFYGRKMSLSVWRAFCWSTREFELRKSGALAKI